jgi:hypothetical protein
VTIPIGSTGSIYLPLLADPTSNLSVKESGATIWQNGMTNSTSAGVAFDRFEGTGSQAYMVWTIGSGSYQFIWNFFPTPTGLTAMAGSREVKLSWNAVLDATGYNVKRSLISGGPYTNVAIGLTGTNYTDRSLSNNISYYYVVSAVTADTESANSSEISATPQWATILGIVQNFSFESPSISTYQYNPSGADWVFTAQSGSTGSGISANDSPFTSGNPNAPQGVQAAFLQGTATISQMLIGLIVGAIYQVTFSAAQRNNIYGYQAGQTWELQMDGTPIGTYAPPESAQNYVDYCATFTASAAGNHTIAFVGTDTNGGDNTVFIDNVRLALAPSLVPPNLAWLVADQRIQFVWPPDHTGWELQIQTNSPGSGLGTNWVTVSGTAFTNQFVFPINPASSGSVYFRLVCP